jgi:hypothetical protein
MHPNYLSGQILEVKREIQGKKCKKQDLTSIKYYQLKRQEHVERMEDKRNNCFFNTLHHVKEIQEDHRRDGYITFNLIRT